MSYRALAVLLLLAAPAACKKANSAAGGGPGGPGGFAMPVEVAAAIRDTVVDAIAATGQIEAIQSIELRPEVSGRITDILVREGQDVADGTPRSEEHTSELQSQSNLVCRLLLEKKKTLHPPALPVVADLEIVMRPRARHPGCHRSALAHRRPLHLDADPCLSLLLRDHDVVRALH